MTRAEAIINLKTMKEHTLPGNWYEDEALDMAISALEQTTPMSTFDIAKQFGIKLEPCEDAVSRDAAKEMINDIRDCISVEGYWAIQERLKKLPSVTVRQTGEWIEKDGYDGDVYYDCSVCGESWTTIEGTPWDNGMNFCPNCGADMRGAE